MADSNKDHLFKKGNQFWKLRSKHGKDKIFTDPKIMLAACYEYFEYANEQVWYKNEAIKGGDMAGEIIHIPTAVPFKIEKLCSFLHVNTDYFNQFEKRLDTSKKIDNDFSGVIIHVKEMIYAQKFEGASVGAFNANIIARDLGLADKQDVNAKVDHQLTDTDRQKIIDNLGNGNKNK